MQQTDDSSISVTVDIAASPQRVWEVLTAFGDYARWHPTLSADGEIPQAAARADVHFRLSGGAAGDQEFSARIIEAAAPTLLVWEAGVPDLFFGRHSFELAESAQGGTRVTDTEVFTGSMAASVVAEKRVVLHAEYLRNAEALKKAAEG